MEATADSPRAFSFPFGSINMTERRIMAKLFGVNWDAIEIDLAEIPKPEDPDDITYAEKVALAKALTKVIGPNERFAMLFTAVKRQLPASTEAEILKRADAGEWALSLGDEEEVAEEAAPLPAPTAPSETTSSSTSA